LCGYLLAIARLDKMGHRRLQLLGFAMMGLCFLVIAAIPGMTTMVVLFLAAHRGSSIGRLNAAD
jgi:MFS transporter, PHS family, inorganic phosphate transporter